MQKSFKLKALSIFLCISNAFLVFFLLDNFYGMVEIAPK
ncbi:MAG: putative membrane protein [Candidatus Endobugula sp.]|jgi:predicted membrane protein